MPSTQPTLGVMIASIITRLFLPIMAGLFAMRFLSPILALLLGLVIGIVINWLFTKITKTYAIFLQFLWFAGSLGYLGVYIPFINKTTPSGKLGIALGIALLVFYTGVLFYFTRTQRLDLSKGQDNLFRLLPIVLFFVVLVGGIIRLPITTINGYGWNSGGGVIFWVILSGLIAMLISMGMSGIYMTIVFTWRGIRETLGFVYTPVKINRRAVSQNPASQSTERKETMGYDADQLRRQQAEAVQAEQAGWDASQKAGMDAWIKNTTPDRPTTPGFGGEDW